jgi:hypothetical protein
MTGKQALAMIAIGLAAYSVFTLLPDIRRYIRISTM